MLDLTYLNNTRISVCSLSVTFFIILPMPRSYIISEKLCRKKEKDCKRGVWNLCAACGHYLYGLFIGMNERCEMARLSTPGRYVPLYNLVISDCYYTTIL